MQVWDGESEPIATHDTHEELLHRNGNWGIDRLTVCPQETRSTAYILDDDFWSSIF